MKPGDMRPVGHGMGLRRGYAMSKQVGGRVFRIRDQVKWQLLGAEGESLEMHGQLSAIRVQSDPIGVAVDQFGQAWLIDLAKCKHEHEESDHVDSDV